MLAKNSERQKVMYVIKKETKRKLEKMAEREHRNASRQLEYLIEFCSSITENYLQEEMLRAEANLNRPEAWLTDEQLTEILEK